MRKVIFFFSVILLASCVKHDDFAITGTVVDYEICNGISEMGYAIEISSPDSIGGDYTTRTGDNYRNVIVVYGADRILKENAHINARIYWDKNYSKTTCSRHYTDRDVPEAVFTKID